MSRPGSGHSFRFQNLGGHFETAVDCISKIHHDMGSMMGTHPESQQYLQGFLGTSEDYLHLTHADDRMRYASTHVVDANTPVPEVDLEMSRLQRMPRRGRGRVGQRALRHDEAGTSNQGQRPQHDGAGTSNEGQRALHDEAGTSNQGQQAHLYHDDPSHISSYDMSGIFEYMGDQTPLSQLNVFDSEPSDNQFRYMTPPPNMPFQSLDSSQSGHIFNNCYHVTPNFGENVNINNSPVSFEGFGGIDLNVPWEQQQQHEEEEEQIEQFRPRRNRRAPLCGTGGRLGHRH